MTTLNVTNIKHASSSTNNLVLNSNGSVTGAGKILQVIQTVKTDFLSTTSATYVDVVSASITPSSTSSKILTMFHAMECTDSGDGNTYSRYLLLRGSTSIYTGDAAGSAGGGSSGRYGRQGSYNTDPVQIMYLDSPSTTSATTYKVQFNSTRGSSWRVSVGGSYSTDFAGYTRVPTNLILMEVSA